jgi:hypothetical protein
MVIYFFDAIIFLIHLYFFDAFIFFLMLLPIARINMWVLQPELGYTNMNTWACNWFLFGTVARPLIFGGTNTVLFRDFRDTRVISCAYRDCAWRITVQTFCRPFAGRLQGQGRFAFEFKSYYEWTTISDANVLWLRQNLPTKWRVGTCGSNLKGHFKIRI